MAIAIATLLFILVHTLQPLQLRSRDSWYNIQQRYRRKLIPDTALSSSSFDPHSACRLKSPSPIPQLRIERKINHKDRTPRSATRTIFCEAERHSLST
ncbi:uncharacterized protein BP01DRAFT_232391 [Aspergillus saccharolyticus JOP 1030-1]|uniref:Secreted protein n=1 Tax=Aspergillus saccharolyticus JOP 1030-1 TaxID=1450539 RepID=A0A318YZV6_9EURO|nr:hypothetical protein BP01DRAFT_232391 [Aspergillus saccharolyticus JOP 1030-1]PYH40149.1 hypothetical protein BP01DRAFT_232391 [Aspergillus saccharolyticus JOP 1030-1]